MRDILVVGGGIAGTSAAASALAPHAKVTLLEAESVLGYHASGRSAAMFVENYGNAAVRALNRASMPALQKADVLTPRGLLMVGLREEAESFHADAAAMDMQPLSTEEARARVPILSPKIAFAACHEEALDIDTDRLLQGYVRSARGSGAIILTSRRVDGISRNGRWRVHCGNETYVADAIVNAAGAWADIVAAMAGVEPIGLQAFRRSMARLPAACGMDARTWPMLFGPGETWYAKPDAGGWIVSPADMDPVAPMDAWADDLVLAEGLVRYEAHVSEPVTRVESNWAGLRTFAPDRTLVIGEDPATPGFYWLAGQGGYGFQTAPAAANLIAAQVSGSESQLDAVTVRAVSPSRFRAR